MVNRALMRNPGDQFTCQDGGFVAEILTHMQGARIWLPNIADFFPFSG